MIHVSITLIYVTRGSLAIGFEFPDGGEGILWIPMSQLRNLDKILETEYRHGDKVEIEVPQWLAEKKGIDPYCEELEDEVK